MGRDPAKTERIVIYCREDVKERYEAENGPAYDDAQAFLEDLLRVKEDHPELFNDGLWD